MFTYHPPAPVSDIVGSLDTATLLIDGSAYFSGWAFNTFKPGEPVSWFIFQGSKLVLSGRTAGVRSDVAEKFGPAAAMSSFQMRSPEYFGNQLEIPISLIVATESASVACCGYRSLTLEQTK